MKYVSLLMERMFPQLGRLTPVSQDPLPPSDDVIVGAVAIATGSVSTCALTNTSAVVCWGSNLNGQVRGVLQLTCT